MTTKLTSNYPGYSANDIPTNQKYITLRTAQDDPMSWAEFDNNFELLRYTVNSLVDDIAVVREDVDYGAEIAVINETIQANYTALDAKFNDYLTIAVADTTYFKKSDEIDAYTKTEVDTNFAAKSDLNDYVLTSVLDDYVTGTELTTFGASYALAVDVPDAYTKQESDARYYQGTPSGTGGEDSITALYAFGNSYTDSGNYPDELWTDREDVWVQYLAQSLSVPFAPSSGGGTNYAFGGARLIEDVDQGNNIIVPSIQAQINSAPSFTSNDLVAFFGGGNDYLGAGESSTYIFNGIESNLRALIAKGAQNIVVLNMVNLFTLPATSDQSAQTVSEEVNASLATLVESLRSTYSVKIYLVDLFALVDSISASPASYDISEVFYDTVHLTEEVHRVIANKAYELYSRKESGLPDGYVNADDYCVGDGVTDDTLNLQAAIDSLGSKGGTVLLGSKVYLLANNDGNMPWDEIPTTLNEDQILKGNGANGVLDGTENFLHPAYIIYATARNLTQDSSGFQSMVGTWNGTEFSGGTDSAGFNYWATSNEPAITFWVSIYEAEITNKHLKVNDHVSIVGTTESCGAPSWNQATGSYATPKGSTILIRNNTTITLKRDAALRNVSVLKDGLNGLVSSFGGYGVRPSGDDVTIENCFIGGFEYGIYANWSNPDTSMKGNMLGPGGRLRVTACNMDNLNSILVQGSWDITYIERVHSWPFLTAHPSSNSSAPASWDWSFFTVRQGTAFSILGVNDWTKITDCFSYGYETGFHIKGGRNVIMRGCGADNASVSMTRAVTPGAQDLSQGGYNVLPDSKGFHIEINNLSSEELYGDYRAIIPQDSNNDGFINHSEKFKGGTGSFSLVNCQAAAQSVGFELHTNNDESGTLTACQSWYCDSHIKAKGSVKVSVMNHLVDNAGYVASGTTGGTGLHAEGSSDIMAFGIQFRELSNATFANKTLGSNVNITGQQDV